MLASEVAVFLTSSLLNSGQGRKCLESEECFHMCREVHKLDITPHACQKHFSPDTRSAFSRRKKVTLVQQPASFPTFNCGLLLKCLFFNEACNQNACPQQEHNRNHPTYSKNTEADSFACILVQTLPTYLSYYIYLALKYPYKASELMLHGGKVKYLYLRATLSGSLNM